MSVDRTGQFTYQQHSVAQPDAISLTKGVTSDIPIDVISAHEDMEFTKGEPKKKDPTIAEYCREHRSLVNAGILIRSCTSFSSLGETFVHRLSGNVWENKQIFVEGECS